MGADSQANRLSPDRRPRTILMIAHPGHELRVHGWLETALSEVWILTDGSGRTRRSRIDSTTRVLEATGAARGPVYGDMTDGDLYEAVLGLDHRRFKEYVNLLAEELIRKEIDYVAGDAAEGYNPAHDICRFVINAAIRLVKRKTTKQIANYDFTLAGAPGQRPEDLRARSLWIDLDDAALARKLSAAENYPELQAEVASALNGETFHQLLDLAERARATFGVTNASNFRVECLRPINGDTVPASNHVPFYEAYGEKQVMTGNYSEVIRYREHLLPLAAALDRHVEESS